MGEVASQLGVPRPAYDTIRILLRENRARRAEIRRLLDPVAGDILRGLFSPWDVDRIREAAALAADARRARKG